MTLHFLVPAGSAERPSGGNIYDRRVQAGLVGLGRDVVAHEVASDRDVAADQISQKMNTDSRRAFRGPIAVELRLALPAGRNDASLTIYALLDAFHRPATFASVKDADDQG